MTKVFNKSIQKQALTFVKGCYQRNLLLGHQILSGADLQGTAKSYIGRYRQSGANLMERLKLNNIDVKEVISDYNRREIWIGYETHKRKLKEKYCEF